jgi:beta-ring hydroxylase
LLWFLTLSLLLSTACFPLAQLACIAAALRAWQVDAVVPDGLPTVEQLRELRFTTRVINESMRLYPQPPVLIRR